MSTNPFSKLSSTGADFTPTQHHDSYAFIDPAQFDLAGRAVLVTGASKGIGRAIAVSFAKAGATQIALAARSDMGDTVRAVQEAASAAVPAPDVLVLAMDVTSEASVAACAREVEARFGRLDVLVNNAGFAEPWVPVADSKVADYKKGIEINLLGVYMVTRAFLPLVLKKEAGLKTLLNVSSAGAHVLVPGASCYQTSKLALLRFTEFIASEYGTQGLVALSIHPGGVMTDMGRQMPEWLQAQLNDTPALAGDAVVWLTARRREWLAGRYVSVNWDMGELLDKREKIEEGDLLKVRMDVGLE